MDFLTRQTIFPTHKIRFTGMNIVSTIRIQEYSFISKNYVFIYWLNMNTILIIFTKKKWIIGWEKVLLSSAVSWYMNVIFILNWMPHNSVYGHL